ncbi:MAG: class I SAM-dependent RNA methyltransferase [Candidatus Margulisiibacteriota bacterium]
MTRPEKNQIIELEITNLAYGGEGVGRYEGYVVFVPWTVPGDRVRARLVQRKRDYGRAEVEEMLRESSLRVKPPCPYFSVCGGCRWQNLGYEDQLKFKQKILQDELRIGKRSFIESPLSILPAPEALYYRNKMEFTFGEWDGQMRLGLHRVGDYRQIVDLEECLLQTHEANRVYKKAREFLLDKCRDTTSPVSIYNKNTHHGLLRYLILRSGGGKVLVNLVTNEPDTDDQQDTQSFLKQFVDTLKDMPEIDGIIHSVSSTISDAVKVEKETILWGRDFLQEKVGKVRYNIHGRAFFQTNTAGTEILYDIVREFAVRDFKQVESEGNNEEASSSVPARETGCRPTSRVILDLYCGVGSIGLYLADLAKELIGIEIIPEAIDQARENAVLNGCANARFFTGDVQDVLSDPDNSALKTGVDILIIDPPRGGMTNKALKRLLEVKAPKMIYVSCNPTTLARDLEKIEEAGYTIIDIRAVDMFPQTYHLETVVLLEKA